MQKSETLFQALLGREIVPPDEKLMKACIQGRSVMVTGAGGSIGAELCQQLATRQPKALILLERSEYSLYALENALRQRLHALKQDVQIIPVLGAIQDEVLVEKSLSQYRVDVIFHAAAYKQVPMLEKSVIAGIRNNVFGTLVLARAAEKCGVDSFIFISTDKAVKPINVMGATKRLAEQVVQAMNGRDSSTRYSIVRFGNVLGSSGSVLPLFHEQISNGGPVTVTHPEVSRYFMTATEAAQLVIQAGALARGGEVFVLDMHGPVRIADMARKLIAHLGYQVCDTCTGDACLCKQGIRIEYTGLRPGEKLSEELLFDMVISKTEHPKIRQGREQSHAWSSLARMLENLEEACLGMDDELARHALFDATSVPVAANGAHPARPVLVENTGPVKKQTGAGKSAKVAVTSS